MIYGEIIFSRGIAGGESEILATSGVQCRDGGLIRLFPTPACRGLGRAGERKINVRGRMLETI